jgi:hypothetical protein
MKISISNMGRLPEPSRYNPLEAQKFLLSPEAPKGSAFLTPVLESTVKAGGRAEAEAIIVPGTHLKQTSIERNFFNWNGRKVELKEYKTVESDQIMLGKTGSKEKDLVTAEDLFISYRTETQGYKGLISEIALPFRSSSSVVDPLRSSSSVVDPLRSSSSVVDPLRSSSSVVDPFRTTPYTGYTPEAGYTPDPFPLDPIPKKKRNVIEDVTLESEPLEQLKNIRKTKKRMVKNVYGDPFKIKLKL